MWSALSEEMTCLLLQLLLAISSPDIFTAYVRVRFRVAVHRQSVSLGAKTLEDHDQ
jgi:hypothetical protein